MLNPFAKFVVAAGLALCAGVVGAKSTAPVKVEFVQKDQYQPGAPIEITVTVAVAASVDAIEVQFRGTNGLSLLEGQQLARGPTASGERIEHTIKLSAPANGRYYLSAVIHTSSQGNLLAKVVSIPVTIGNVAKAKPSTRGTQIDAAGERIKSLPAVEPKS